VKFVFFNKILVFLAVICFSFKAFSIGAFVVPLNDIKPIQTTISKINHSDNYTIFQYQTHMSSLFDIDNEEIEEDIDGDDNHANLDFICTKKYYFHLKISQKSKVHAFIIRKKLFAESTPIFIQFRNFRL